MATIKIIHYTSKKYKDKTSPVLLRLTIQRKIRNFSLPDNYTCLPRQWDKRNSRFNFRYPNYDDANTRLTEAYAKAENIIRSLNRKNNDEGFTHDEFAELFKKKSNKLYLLQYFDQRIKRIAEVGSAGNAAVYLDSKKQFEIFFETDLEMSKVTLKQLNLYVEKCYKKGLKDTTIHARLRTLRALFNIAKKEEGLENYPFEAFNWKQFNLKTEKRALSKGDVCKIRDFNLESDSTLFDAKNYWLLSLYCAGLNFSDHAKLEAANIISEEGDKTLVYVRSKTKKTLKIPLIEQALEILNYYLNQNYGKKYIFPILDPDVHQTPHQINTRIKTALKKYNGELNEFALKVGIEKHLTSYVARHSFATILKKELVSTDLISELLGHHEGPISTQIYLDEYTYSQKADAIRKLL